MTSHRWSSTAPAPRGLVRPVRIDPSGVTGPTRGQTEGPNWRRTSQGRYVRAGVDGDRVEQRILEQSARLPALGAVTGWAALRLAGGGFFDGLDRDGRTRLPVPLAVGRTGRIRADGTATVSREPLDPSELVRRHGVPCTGVERATFDAVRAAGDLREAGVVLDMAAAADLVSVSRMAAYWADHRSWRRARLVRRALPLCSELSRSPAETRMRLLWVLDAGLPAPLVNQDVFTRDGRLVAVADLLDPVAGVVGEYDGADHRGARRHASDVAREHALRELGLEYFTVTGPDLAHPARVVERMRATRARARFLSEPDRAWTVVAPAHWPVAPTLDQVLEHRDLMEQVHRDAL